MNNNPKVIVGAQFGDEGKGKITDLLAEKADYVVRYQGGNNAGHTIKVGETEFKLHLLPSGVVHGKECFIGNGVVLDPEVLLQEINYAKENGLDVQLSIDPLVNIIMPYHKLLDGVSESALNDKSIGTTKKGIGPAYEDKFGRRGIRLIDLLDRVAFKEKLTDVFQLKKKIVEKVYGKAFLLNFDKVYSEYLEYGSQLQKYLTDVSRKLSKEKQKSIIFEGAQGTFLDITYGTYPYVTSSHPISGSVFLGAGIAPQELNTIGIVKAYTTRVGEGPFVTELYGKLADYFVDKGKEFGTTTGRKRRCGWLDLVMLRYAHRLNGFTSLAVTKLDVLSGLDEIKVAIDYQIEGTETSYPLTCSSLEKCEPVYKSFAGFAVSGNEKSYDDLEEKAKVYLDFIQEYLDVPISILSIGPDRNQTIFL